MTLNNNDIFEMSLFNTYYYFEGMNLLYAKLILFLNDIGAYKLKNTGLLEYRSQLLAIEKYFDSDYNTFKKLLKFAIDNGFDEDLSIRYQFINKYTRDREEDNKFGIVKFKIIDNKLFAYNMILSSENQAFIEVETINGFNINDIVQIFKNDGYTNEQISSMIQHKEILTAYGFESKQFEVSLGGLKIDLSDPNIKFDYDIFYKEHEKSSILDKSNFSMASNIGEVRIDSSYGFDSNMKLLEMLHGLSKSETDLKLFETIYKMNSETIGYCDNGDTNIDWMYISTFFLMNREEKGDLPDYIYPDLERKLKLNSNGGPWLVFLDESNEELSFGYNVDDNSYGCNSYIYHDGKYDTKMIFHAVRDAIAHSSYEVVDQDYIRVFGYDERNNIMNCNFKIKKDIVIEFINKISEFRSFGNLFPVCTLEEPNVNNVSIKSEEELKKYLKKIIVSYVDIKSYKNLDQLKLMQQYARLIEHIINPHPDINYDDTYLSDYLEYDYSNKIRHMSFIMKNPMCRDTKEIRICLENELKIFADYDYKELKLSDEQMKRIIDQIKTIKDTFYFHSAYNQHSIITELIKNELNPSRNISMVLNDIINTQNKNNGTIMDTLNATASKYIDYDKVIKASIIAYLNNILLYNFNGNNVDCSELDFSEMSKNLQPLIDSKQNRIDGLKRENRNKRKTISNNEKRLSILDRIIASKNGEDPESLEEKINKTAESTKLREEVDVNQQIISVLELEIEDIRNNGVVDSYYILEHLRNSLAHGNIFFSNAIDINNLSDLEIIFVDYYSQKRQSAIPIESFRGTIKFGQLLGVLNNEKFIKSLFKIKKNSEQKKS